VRSRFSVFGRRLRAGKNDNGLVRFISACGYEQKPSAYPAK